MLRGNRLLVAATAVTLLAASAAWAQPGRGGRGFGSPFMLLSQKSVQDELKLTDDQKKQVEENSAKMREEMQGLRDLEPEQRREKFQEMAKKGQQLVKDILKPEQVKRLNQIRLQVEGLAMAANNPEVAKDLNITDDQKQKIQEIQQETREEMREAFQSQDREKIQEIRKGANDKVEKLLTDEQKTKWKDLTGEPFKGEIRFGPPGGRRNQ